MLKPVKQDKLYKKIVEQIKNLIMEGNLKPGERLPPERDLAEKLNVSRVAVREALLTLEFMGLIEIKRGSGVFIPEELQPELVLNSIDFALNFKENIIEDLVEVRQVLETKMAGLAAKNVIFFRILNQLKVLLVQSGRLSSKSKERPFIALKQHYEIFEAIKRRDVKKAEEVMANHLEGIRKIFKTEQ
jgi:GntR family transcriptional repressor for pyruvate dehydrogenase complex